MSAKAPAPIFTDAFSLSQWLVGRLGDDSRILSRAVCRSALRLLEDVALALKGRDRELRLERADATLISLRVQLRLAAAAGYLSEAQLVHALERADAIGRQLGGWIRANAEVGS